MFPSEISGLFAKSVAVQDQENAGFLISFTPGNFYFTIRALKKDAEDHLTVIFNRKAYVFHLTASDHPLPFCRRGDPCLCADASGRWNDRQGDPGCSGTSDHG